MTTICLNCGTEDPRSRWPCRVCGCALPPLRISSYLNGQTAARADERSLPDVVERDDAVFQSLAEITTAQRAGTSEEDQPKAEFAAPDPAPGPVDKKPFPLMGSVLAVAVVIAGFSLLPKPMKPAPSPSVSAVSDPARTPSVSMPPVLETRWFGVWKTPDGKKTIDITTKKITILTDEWKRSQDDPTTTIALTWTTDRDLKEGQFGYAGKNTSPAAISKEYEEALALFKKGSPDFNVSPSDGAVARHWIARLPAGDYQVLQGYGGGDSLPTEWILDSQGNMFEVTAGHYGFHLRWLERANSQVANGPGGSAQAVVRAGSGDAVPAPLVRVGDTYTYETLDLIDPKLNNVTIREVVEVSSGGSVMTVVNARSKYTRRLFFDSGLNLLSTRSGDSDGMNYSPGLQYFKFPLTSGDTWASSATETNIKTGKTRVHTLRGSVGPSESVTVAAGTFRAVRITIQSELNDEGHVSTGRDISWYAPDVRRTVRSDLESRDSSGKMGRRTVSLVSYRLSDR